MYRTLYVTVAFFVFMHVSPAAGSDERFSNLLEQARTEYRNGAYGPAEKLYAAALQALDGGEFLRRAETLSELGNAYANDDELSKAEKVFDQALTLFKKLGDGYTATGLRHLGLLYTLEGRDDDALPVLKQALKFALRDRDGLLQVDILNLIGADYYRQRNNGKAAASFNDALKIASSAPVPLGLKAQLVNNLGNVYRTQHDYPRAEALLKVAVGQLETASGPSHPDLTWTLLSLGYVYTEMRRYPDAEEQYRRALNILEARPSEFETRIARVLYALGSMYTKAGRRDEADAVLERAVAIARRHVHEHVEMATILEDYSASLKNRGRSSEAAELLSEARSARTAASLVVTQPRF